MEPHDHSAHEQGTHDHAAHEAHAHDPHAGHDQHASHDEHAGHNPALFRRRFWVSLALTLPTLLFSQGLQEILRLDGPRFPGSQFIPAIFGIAIFFYGGLVFLRGAVTELRAKQPGMMTLISLAIVVALGYSVAVTAGLAGMDFWWELATLITIMLLGHWLEMSAVSGAHDALGELAKLLPDEADMVHGDHIMSVPVERLVVGDWVLVRPGEAVPIDGEVVEGSSAVNESLLTGESTPVEKIVGSAVIAGSVNGDGALTIRVTKSSAETAVAGIMKLVRDAQASKSPTQLLADRAAALLFYVAVASAILTLVIWMLLRPDDPSFVLERVVSVLVIACPHALGLAIPLVAQISTSLGARNGILVKSRAALEEARAVDVVLFDKTGTLTTGVQEVANVVAADGHDEVEVLALAAAVEARSEHPIARAIVAAAASGQANAARATGFRSQAGRGATATILGRPVTVGGRRVLNERGLTLPPELVLASSEHAATGATIVYVESGEEVLGLIALADAIRPESAQAVALLKSRGIRVAMLTGDSHLVGEWIGSTLGIEEVYAEVLPGEKADVVARLQKDGSRVAMVGDGVNDAPALAQADIGIAIGAGADVAIESAGIVLASSDPVGVAATIALSRATWRKELQNLFWATGYNLVGIPLAAGVAFGAGILLAPAVAAILMSASTVIVALNAQLLRRLRQPHATYLRRDDDSASPDSSDQSERLVREG